ncbi:hypothetical protein TRIP_D300139 [uncultured Paludibacter sp.]|nr:hypothetical protein TRIP_D300139 [uncultured Paludibacter sp.]
MAKKIGKSITPGVIITPNPYTLDDPIILNKPINPDVIIANDPIILDEPKTPDVIITNDPITLDDPKTPDVIITDDSGNPNDPLQPDITITDEDIETEETANPSFEQVIKNNSALKNIPVFVKCTWTAAYSQPMVNKGLRAISYNSFMIDYWKKKYQSKIKDSRIGTLTGNYTIDAKGDEWFEIVPAYCNRLTIAWVRSKDVKKEDNSQVDTNAEKKQNNLLKWIVGGLIATSIFS